MVAENNAPSIRGVEKAGFVKYAEGHKTKLHRFVTDKNMNGKYNSTFRLRKRYLGRCRRTAAVCVS